MKTPSAKASAMIKKELKAKFPDVRFTACSKKYSMCDSVTVSWDNGPTRKQIAAVIGRFKYGRFNRMEARYEYTNVIKDLPQTEYLHLNRTITEDIYLEAFHNLKDDCDCLRDTQSVDDWISSIRISTRGFLARIISNMDLRVNRDYKTAQAY